MGQCLPDVCLGHHVSLRAGASWILQALSQLTHVLLPRLKVEIEHQDGTTTLEVGEDETILECALDHGLELSHDCKMGVCMTCPAKLVGLGSWLSCNSTIYVSQPLC